ncbi:DUF4136 domain-containing protein [Parashewanella curva]|uniref:DUF4136 domain-containing protein n=1 Tax=Parashewanella curva TaxID=2338552 RepID=A0A3L8Q381_9GAMM|nr:DUF4136 domain-containing protein [Parashewanella curva]RLV61483.1 DUF4136 domain-containing protein [Parashewanella curva]
MKKYLILVMALMLTACSSTRGNWDYNPKVDFGQYKTFAWVNKKAGKEGYQLDGLMSQRIHRAVNEQLQAKGLTKTNKRSADVLVNYITKKEKKFDVDTFHSRFGYFPYTRNWWWGGTGSTTTHVREYKVGTLFVDIVDNKTGELIWRGSSRDIIRNYKTPEKKTANVNKMVADILSNFPPKPEK